MKKLLIIMLCSISLMTNAQPKENDKMYNLLVKFNVKPEAVQVFKEASLKSLLASRKEAGNIEMKLYADDNKNSVFYVYSRWDNEAAYEFHKTLPHSVNIAKVAKMSLLTVPEIMPLGATLPIPAHDLKQVNAEDKEETLFFIFKIKEGYRDRVIERFETHIKHSRTEEGNLLFDFYTIDGDDNTFVVYENWRSKSALFDIHLKTPYSEVTGALLGEAMIGEMDQYMNFVRAIEPDSTYSIEKNWETKGFAMPESVVADPNSDWLYVSNINTPSDAGYLSRVSKAGKVDNYKWIEGLDQPCGLAIYDNRLYVGDQSKVHIIDLTKGEIIKSLSAEGAKTLNDVAISDKGQVFISDVMSGSIYTIEQNELVIWIEKSDFMHPNGLYVDGEQLIVADLGDKIGPNFMPEIPGSVYSVNITDKTAELLKPGFQLGSLDGVCSVNGKYIITNNGGGELYAITSTERILLGSFAPGNADLSSEGNVIYIPNFAGTLTAFTIQIETSIQLKKGSVQVTDFGNVKLHAYQTMDLMNNYVLILEKAGKAVMIESPAFWDNFEELRSYLGAQQIQIDAILPSYHPLGARFIETKALKDMDIYFTQHVLDYWENGYGAVMKAGIPQAFGDKVDASFYQPTVILEEGETEIAGFKMIIVKSYDGFDIEIPEINTVYVHILGHDVHSEILGPQHLESSIVSFKSYLDQGYATFLSSHYAPETKEDMQTKVAYLENMVGIVAESESSEAFIKNMKAAYPDYKEGYLPATARSFYINEEAGHQH